MDNPEIDFFESEQYKAYEKKIEEKRKYIKKGDNVIHLEYLSGILSENEFTVFEKKLENVGLLLSRFDRNGVIYACIDKYSLVTFIVVAQPLIGELIKGVSSNATWDAIKFIAKSIWTKIKNRTYTRATNQEMTIKDISFGLKVKLDKNTSFEFELSGGLDDDTIDKSLDKVFNFIENQKINKKYKRPKYVYYDDKDGKWIPIDVDKEIRRMIANGSLNKK